MAARLKYKIKEPKRQPAPNLSIHDMLEIAAKIEQETGRYPSYGEVFAALSYGKIKPKDYIKERKEERWDVQITG